MTKCSIHSAMYVVCLHYCHYYFSLFTSIHTHKITKFHSFLYVSEATNGSPKARLIVWLGKTTFLRIAITFNAFPSFFVFVWQKKPFHLKRWAYYSCGCPWGCTFKSRISFQGYFYILYYTHIFFQFSLMAFKLFLKISTYFK